MSRQQLTTDEWFALFPVTIILVLMVGLLVLVFTGGVQSSPSENKMSCEEAGMHWVQIDVGEWVCGIS